MSKLKPAYSSQYRQQLVELVLAGSSANEVAKEFGLHATTVAKWVRLDRMGIPSSAKHPSAKPSSGPLNANGRQELIELRRQAAPSPNGARHTGKGYGLVCRKKREDVHTSHQLVRANQAGLPVRTLCQNLKVSISGYYDWHDGPLSKRAKANVSLSERIVQAHQTSDETYGMPRIRAELADAGIIASRKRIAALMRTMYIQEVSCRRA